MKPAAFDYRRYDDLLTLLADKAQAGGEAQLLAGGQSLVPLMNLRRARPSVLFDINPVRELHGIALRDDEIVIGAATTFRTLLDWPLLPQTAPLLAKALPFIGYPAVRNKGTVGGSLAFADPAAELSACALSLGATLTLSSVRETRDIAADAFFLGQSKTALADDEVLTAVTIPRSKTDDRFAFLELSRRSMDAPVGGAAISARRDTAGLRDLRIAIMGLSDRPILVPATARFLESSDGSPDPRAVREIIVSEIEPIGDARCDAATRLHFASVLVARAVATLQRQM